MDWYKTVGKTAMTLDQILAFLDKEYPDWKVGVTKKDNGETLITLDPPEDDEG